MANMNPHASHDLFTVQVARTIGELEKYRSEWNRFNRHPNSDIDRFLTVVNYRSEVDRPHVIIILKDGSPVLFIVGRIENSNLELKIGYKALWKPRLRTLAVVYGGILGICEEAPLYRAMGEILSMLENGEVDIVQFSHLKQDSLICRLAREMPRYVCRDHISLTNLHWRIVLPETFNAYLGSLRQKTRKNLRRAARSLEKTYGKRTEIKCFKKIDDMAKFISDAEEVAKKSYQRAIGGGFKEDAVSTKLINLDARCNRFLAFILYIDGFPVAYDRGSLYGDTFYWGEGGYDPEYKDVEPGTNMLFHIVNRLYEQNVRHVDFGFGDALYKQMYCNESWQEESVYIFAPKLKTITINLVRSMIVLLRKHVEGILRKMKLLDKIKRYWRQSLSK